MRSTIGCLLLLSGVLVNRWTLGLIGGWAIAMENPFRFAGVFAFDAAVFSSGILLLIWRKLPVRTNVATVAVAFLLVASTTWGTWTRVFTYKAPLAIARMASWRFGSPMFAFPEEDVQWASDYALEIGVKEGSETLATKLHIAIGSYLLRIGRVTKGRKHFETAVAISSEAKLSEKQRHSALRWLAISHLREGEVEYCIVKNNEDSGIFPFEGGGLWTNPGGARAAIHSLEKILAEDPQASGALWLYNYAHIAEGTWPDGVPKERRLNPDKIRTGAKVPHFKNISRHLGVNSFDLSGGAIMDDFDGDGYLDLVSSSCDRTMPLSYYHNNGDGTFTSWTEQAGLSDQLGGLNVLHADYDNDGDLDLFVPRGAWMQMKGRDRNSLLQNDGKGYFRDVTEEAGLGAPDYPCLAGAWGDFDNDGDLDLYLGNEILAEKNLAPSQLFKNNGDGTFTDIAKEAGVINDGHSRGVNWGDFDNDGDLDLAVSNYRFENRLFRNNGDETFTNVAEENGFNSVGGTEKSFGTWFFDVNNDGWLDIFTSTYPLEPTVDPSAQEWLDLPSTYERAKLYMNDGTGRFVEKSSEYGLDRTFLTMGHNFGDIDSDGWMDFYLGTGAPPFETMIPNLLFRNIEGKKFQLASAESGLGHVMKGHGVSFGDLDQDGDLDLWHQLGGWYLDGSFGNALFINEGHDNHWLNIKLVGVDSNRFGVGTRIRALIQAGEKLRTVHAQVGAGASFGGNSYQVELGLGQATLIQELELFWPASGVRQVLENVPVDQCIQVTEGKEKWDVIPMKPFLFLDE
ncbi:MAG: CRTAC1 family protein [Planctomycetota bacterium]|nr:CRTAC1 family protein [Planctomycetota bacterium]